MKTTPQQEFETKKTVQNMIDSGMQLISEQEYKDRLKNFGLKLDEDKQNCFFLYYNTSNEFKSLEVSTTVLDKNGYSFANIYGNFYQNEIKKETEIYSNWKIFRNTYFCLYKGKFILSI